MEPRERVHTSLTLGGLAVTDGLVEGLNDQSGGSRDNFNLNDHLGKQNRHTVA